jgi:SAM-dependent methyltransferase
MRDKYKRAFYQETAQAAAQSARDVVPLVLEYVQPKSVVDVGCGTGEWLTAFRERGVEDIFGIDGPWVDVDLLNVPAERFRVLDLAKPIPADRRFDLVVSLEVAEHLPPEAAETFVDSLVSLGSVVLFSAAIPYQGGTRHLNERWPSYWYQLFAARGFRAVDCLRPRLWANRELAFYYAQNLLFLVHRSQLDSWPTLAEAARHLPDEPLDLVHPRLFLQSTAYAKEPTELFHGVLGALRDQWLKPNSRPDTLRRRRNSRWPIW